jgi:hypothetical protein
MGASACASWLLAHAPGIATESPWAAQGIEAEILFCRKAAKKIGAESPVFLSAKRTKKCAQILLPKNPHP